jgi:broad specificity phosphatase PhoE
MVATFGGRPAARRLGRWRPMTTRLILLGHAATAATRAGRFPDDEPLEDKAVAEAAACAARLPRADRVLAGRERRARQTAAALRLDAEPCAELDDCDYGRWRGRTLADVAVEEPEQIAAWLSDPDAAPHGGESIVALLARIGAWLDRARAHRSLIAISHPAVLRAAILHVLGAPATGFWRIDAGPLALLDLRHDGRRWALRATTLDSPL